MFQCQLEPTNFRVVWVNDNACKILNVSPEKIIGRKAIMFLDEESGKLSIKRLSQMKHQKLPYISRATMLHDNQEVLSRWLVSPILDKNNRIVEIRSCGTTIHNQRKTSR